MDPQVQRVVILPLLCQFKSASLGSFAAFKYAQHPTPDWLPAVAVFYCKVELSPSAPTSFPSSVSRVFSRTKCVGYEGRHIYALQVLQSRSILRCARAAVESLHHAEGCRLEKPILARPSQPGARQAQGAPEVGDGPAPRTPGY
jgi:hypothetical protein